MVLSSPFFKNLQNDGKFNPPPKADERVLAAKKGIGLAEGRKPELKAKGEKPNAKSQKRKAKS